MIAENRARAVSPAFSAAAGTTEGVAGLSKREWMATMCLQGILANRNLHKTTIWSAAQSAILYADQLLECLQKEVAGAPGGDLLRPAGFPLPRGSNAPTS